MSVNKDTATVEEVVDGGDEWGIGKAKVKVKRVTEECGADGGSIVIKYITERGGVQWGASLAMEQMARAGALKRFD